MREQKGHENMPTKLVGRYYAEGSEPSRVATQEVFAASFRSFRMFWSFSIWVFKLFKAFGDRTTADWTSRKIPCLPVNSEGSPIVPSAETGQTIVFGMGDRST